MPRIFDCFLYHNEEELLEIRLQLLSEVVDRFVIVCSGETFTGIKKKIAFPENNSVVGSLRGKIELIKAEVLEGKSAWEKEAFSRNLLSTGLHRASDEDLVMISDIDEMPRPSVIETLKTGPAFDAMKVLEQDYYNFKFNFKMFHGLQAAWAGTAVCMFSDFDSPQEMRDRRWKAMTEPATTIPNAGWHFSFLTDGESVADKLASFSHQEKEIQSRTDKISQMLHQRTGFHDHIHPGSIWGFVDKTTYDCPQLESLVSEYPGLYEPNIVDDSAEINETIRHSVRNLIATERAKIIRSCTIGEICSELRRRLTNKLLRLTNGRH